MAPSVVVLGSGTPGLLDLLPAAPLAHANDADALRRVLVGIDGDVLLVDDHVDCSGGYPVDDVCRPGRTRVLTGAGGTAPVRVAAGQIIAAGTSEVPLAQTQDWAAGCLHVSGTDREALAQALSDVAHGPPGRLWEQLLSVLVMRAVPVSPVAAAPFEVGEGPVGRSPDPVRLQARRCARGGDGWLSERTVRPLSRRVTPVVVGWGWAPNTVTAVSLVAGAGAVVAALTGSRAGYLLTAVLMVVSLVLDCVDGEVARWTHRYSRAGAWLDAVGDRVKEYSVWFAVAWAVGQDHFWWLVLACLVLFTAKHFLDYGWSLRYPPWSAKAIGISAAPDPWQGAGAVPPAVRPPSWRRIFGMPIAERWLLVAVLLPVAGPWVAFGVLTALGAVSLAYTVLTRIRWSHSPISAEMRPQLQALTDPGLLLSALRPSHTGWAPAAAAGLAVMIAAAMGNPVVILAGYAVALGLYALAYGSGPRGRLGWMPPSVARTTEMVVLVALAWFSPAPDAAAVFAVIAAGAWRYYDLIYRIRNQHLLPAAPARVALLGTEGRVLVAIILLVAIGTSAWLWFALYIAVVAVADSVWSWLRG